MPEPHTLFHHQQQEEQGAEKSTVQYPAIRQRRYPHQWAGRGVRLFMQLHSLAQSIETTSQLGKETKELTLSCCTCSINLLGTLYMLGFKAVVSIYFINLA